MTVSDLMRILARYPESALVFVEEPVGDDGEYRGLRDVWPTSARVRCEEFRFERQTARGAKKVERITEWHFVRRRKPKPDDVDGVIL